MLYIPDEQLADGAASEDSGGFFDLDNVPPWDTWLWTEGDSALGPDRSFSWWIAAWVPPAFVDVAEPGRRVNPEQCLRWAEVREGWQLIATPEGW